MKAIFGAIALTLTLTAPANAQTAPVTDPQAGHSSQTAQSQQQGKHGMEDMHKNCREMSKHHAKAHRKAKTAAERIDAEVNGNGHQFHNH